MTKRLVTFPLILLLLLAPTTRNMGTLAQGSTNPVLSKDQANEEKTKTELQQFIADARKNTTYDEAGRMSKVTINLPRLGKLDFEYKYDAENRLQYIIDNKGRRTVFEYGKKGVLSSITLPNGTRMYELDENGKGVFFKDRTTFGKLSVQQMTTGISGFSLIKSALMDDELSDCSDALTTLAIATAAASIACGAGLAPACLVALAAAALAAVKAKNACGLSELYALGPS